jgi:hypothetical protein
MNGFNLMVKKFDRINRMHMIFSWFPEETMKPASAFGRIMLTSLESRESILNTISVFPRCKRIW